MRASCARRCPVPKPRVTGEKHEDARIGKAEDVAWTRRHNSTEASIHPARNGGTKRLRSRKPQTAQSPPSEFFSGQTVSIGSLFQTESDGSPAAKTTTSSAGLMLTRRQAAGGGGPWLVWVKTGSHYFLIRKVSRFYGKTKQGG